MARGKRPKGVENVMLLHTRYLQTQRHTVPWHFVTFPNTPKVPKERTTSPEESTVSTFSYWHNSKKQGRGLPMKFFNVTIKTSLTA